MTTPTKEHEKEAISFDLAMGVCALLQNVAGPVLIPADAGYAAETAAWNLSVRHRPVLTVGAVGEQDVVEAVRFAAAYRLPVAVMATGHGSVVPADGALLITTHRMNAVLVDEHARTVRIEAGVRWGEIVTEAARFGLAPLAGSSPSVGAVSYTLGGGLSPTLGRHYGFAADHVRSIELVTADGQLRLTDPEHDPELFWALRGGKGNFGVVTAMTLDLFPVTRLYAGGLYFGGEHAVAVVAAYRDLTERAPDELSSSFAFLRLPDAPFVPEPLRGRFVVHVRVAFLGSTRAGEKLVAGLRAVAPPIIDTVAEIPFTAFAGVHSDPEGPLPVHESSRLLSELPTGTLIDLAGPEADFPVTLVEVRHLGGALARRPGTPNAVGNRDARFQLFCSAVTSPDTAARSTAARNALFAAVAPWTSHGNVVNFLGADDATTQRVRDAYEPATYARLVGVKNAVDPTNMFRINHNIPPAAEPDEDADDYASDDM